MTEEQIKALFTTGETITEESMAALVDFLQEQKGPKGDKGDTGAAGAKGDTGAKGADGASIKAILFAKDQDGVIIGGIATLTNDETVAITVELELQ